MPAKQQKGKAVKIGRCVRKKIDEKDFLCLRITGKPSTKQIKELKNRLNGTVTAFFMKDSESPSSSE